MLLRLIWNWNKTLRLLIYTHNFAPLIGGAETYVMLLAQGIAHNAAQYQRVQKGSSAVVHTHVTVVTATPADGFDDSTLPFRVVRQPGLRRLWQLIREADMVQLAGPVFLPLLFGLVQRKPIAIEHHGYQACCPNGLLLYEPTKTACPGHFMARRYHKCVQCNTGTQGWVKSFLALVMTFPRRALCHFAAVNIPVSQNVQHRVRFVRSQVIYHGIPDPEENATQEKGYILRDLLTFAYVGRLVSEKGLSLLLEAAHRLKEQGYTFHIKFVGDGPQRQHLEKITDAFGLRDQVTFTGFMTGENLAGVLEDAAAVVMPSIWEETAGLAAIEQMMRGRLVIASDIGGLGEIVGDAGLTFPMGDVEQLAACMQRVLDEPDVIQSLGQTARARALKLFHQDRMVAEHLAMYAELL